MTQWKGSLRKMQVQPETPVQYFLPIGGERVGLNDVIDRECDLTFTGEIHCIECGRKTNKSFQQGYCYPCFRSLAACDTCIVKPELCHFHSGTCREPSWGEAHCMQPHVVYLANSSGLKVGITRRSQVPTRWIDQGATQALAVFEVESRLISGLIEVALKSFVNDRTDWRRMLRGPAEALDLHHERDRLIADASTVLEQGVREGKWRSFESVDEEVFEFEYPVARYPEKVRSHNLDKQPTLTGVLTGIKGQYLMLGDVVINIRKYAGYVVNFSYK